MLFLDQAGQVGGKIAILGIVTDISEYKLENILTRSEEKYLKLLESSKDGVYGIKGDEFIYVNTRATVSMTFPIK